jgi:hypothetical protein
MNIDYHAHISPTRVPVLSREHPVHPTLSHPILRDFLILSSPLFKVASSLAVVFSSHMLLRTSVLEVMTQNFVSNTKHEGTCYAMLSICLLFASPWAQISFSAPFPVLKNFSLCSSLNLTDQVSHSDL